MRVSKLLFVASWVILLLLTVSAALISAISIRTAYGGGPDNITASYSLEQLTTATSQEVALAIRGRRATAASWALGCALLSIFVVLVPYRRGEKWAWWALLIAWGIPQFISLARAVPFGSSFGTSAPATVLALLLLGLMAGAPRIFARPDPLAEPLE
ncbi:MAG TPA: hypothetical protein VNH22_07185 [Blastocatellia bacterium]|jgi:hypothetical protein|nr:hypothetical protein [Blastocatellia bacterium]